MPPYLKSSVRVFKTFTEDLNLLADWLEHCAVTTVAMESTGRIPIYEILETRSVSGDRVN